MADKFRHSAGADVASLPIRQNAVFASCVLRAIVGESVRKPLEEASSVEDQTAQPKSLGN